MDFSDTAGKVDLPKPGSWPGKMEAFRLVSVNIKPQIWNFVSVIGIGILASLVINIFIGAIFKHTLSATFISDLLGVVVGAFLQATVISMYFAYLHGEDMSFSEALSYGYPRTLKMTGLLIMMYIILVVSFILLIVPFFFILPRVYLAPYFLIADDLTVSEAIATSWHLTKDHVMEVYGILLISLGCALLFITIIGIPFGIYWGIINSGSFALLTMYLSQPKKSPKVLKSAKT